MDVDFYYFQFCLSVCMFRLHLLNHTSGRAQTFRWGQSTYIRGRVMNGLDVNCYQYLPQKSTITNRKVIICLASE